MRRTRSLVLAFALIAVGIVVVDQLTKIWALDALVPGERTPLLGDLLGLELVRNSGAALSIATGSTWIFTIAATAVTVVVLRMANRLGSRGWTVALGLLLGGAVGNLIDRLFREPAFARGHVVDFIAYADWFVGNVADIAIVAAAVLMVLLGLRGIGIDGRRSDEAGEATVPDADVPDDERDDDERADDERPGVQRADEAAEPARRAADPHA